MKKVKLLVTSLCLLVTLTLLIPTVANATDGPQGGTNSGPTAPPPPPPPPPGGSLGDILAKILKLIY
jgi:hypothetical protein